MGRSKSCTVAQPDATLTTFGAGDATLEITGGPLAFRLLWKGAPVATSITDQHFRGYTRLPAFGRIRQGGEWAAAIALASGEPVYGLGEKFGPLDKRGQLIHSQVEDALGVNTGLVVQEHAVRVESRHRPRRVGRVRAHAGTGRARRRAPGLVAPQLCARRRRRGARPVPVRRRHAGADPRRLHRAHRPRARGAARGASACGCRARTTRPPRRPSTSRRSCASGAFPATSSRSTAGPRGRSRRASTSAGIPDRFADPSASLAAIQAHDLRVCVWEYPVRLDPRPAVPGARSRRTTCSRTSTATRTCSRGTPIRRRAPSATC